MKKIIIIAAAIIMAACSSDPIKEKLAASTNCDGYKFRNYTIIDTVTNGEAADSIQRHYLSFTIPVMPKDEIIHWRDMLSENLEFDKERLKSLGVVDELKIWDESDKTIAMLDKIIDRYESLNRYDIDYQIAATRFFYYDNILVDSGQDEEWLDKKIILEYPKTAEDFKMAAALQENEDGVFCYKVLHEYSEANRLIENGPRIIQRKIVKFGEDWNIIE